MARGPAVNRRPTFGGVGSNPTPRASNKKQKMEIKNGQSMGYS